MARLLLVTILTLIAVSTTTTATIQLSDQNVTVAATTTTTATVATITPTKNEVTKEYVFAADPPSNSSSAVNAVVVETGGDDVQVPAENVQEDGTAFVNLAESNNDSTETQVKIETKVAAGDAPKIITHITEPVKEPLEIVTPATDDLEPVEAVPQTDDEDFSDAYMSSDAPVVVKDSEKTTISTASTVVEKTSTTVKVPSSTVASTPNSTEIVIVVTPPTPYKKTTKVSEKPLLKALTTSTTPESIVILVTPTDNETIVASSEVYDLRYNGTEMDLPKDNADLYPKTTWDKVYEFFGVFTKEHPKTCYVALFLLLAVLSMLVFLVVRECCRSRRNRRYPHASRNPRYRSVTSDLYNTSSCSQYYTKPMLLPHQENVTMQLMPSDVSSDDV